MMRELIKSKIFIGTFLLIYFSFFIITTYIVNIGNIEESSISLGMTGYGFPFIYYSSHCFGGNFYWTGLLGDILVAAIISFITGLSFSYIFSYIRIKLTSPEFRAKWYI